MSIRQKIYASLRPDALVAFWLGVWWICNLFQAGFTELANDEAYYHMFAENLAWGYFDHPPMTALLVWLGEHLFGGELGVRFFFTVLQPLYLYILWRIIRPADADRRDAALFVVLSAATLMLQLYGFIAVPDGPLMMTAALFLLTFKWFTEGRRAAWLWMGVAMALMAYSKYHGALVVLFALAATPPRLFLRPTLYLSGAVALLLLVPHFVWQYEHDWASLAYHLAGRNSVFRPNYVAEYLLNLLVVFNPFFVPLYVKAWIAVKPQNAVERALKFIPVAFIVFFLLSTFRGYVQPQWVIVAVFGLIYTLFTYARRHSRTRRYLMRMGWVTLALIALTRLVMIFNPLGIRYEVFDNRTSYGRSPKSPTAVPSFSATVTPLQPNTPSIPAERPTASPISATGPTNGSSVTTIRALPAAKCWSRRLMTKPTRRAASGRRTAQRQAFHVVRRYAFPSDPPCGHLLHGASRTSCRGRYAAAFAANRKSLSL
ncbi:MAG: glycosyltransferase family 39 protein [Alistipes sp.]